MKERLLLSRDPPLASMDDASPHDNPDNQMLEVHHTPVGTVVKVRTTAPLSAGTMLEVRCLGGERDAASYLFQ